MATNCRGACMELKTIGIMNGLKYQNGQKRCTYCGLFLETEDIRCPCCKTILRTKPRSKKRISRR